MKSYVEEFYRQYEQPRVDKLIVGFSGLDPSRKSLTDIDASKLTTEQLEVFSQMILGYMSKLTIRVDSGNVDPEAEESEPFYLPLKTSEIQHEELGGLLGGSAEGHYHVTDMELSRLRKLADELMPDGENIEIPDVGNHEELSSLFGGSKEGHYHLTNEQLVKLSKLLKLFYPDGAADPVMPTTPDTPEPEPAPEDDDDQYGGLPKGTPPSWQIQAFPSGYSAWNGSYKMYYGGLPQSNSNGFSSDKFMTPMAGSNASVMYLKQTTNGISWNSFWRITNLTSTYGTDINGYLAYYYKNSNPQYTILFLLLTPPTGTGIFNIYRNSNSSSGLNHSQLGSSLSSFTAVCYSSLLDIYLFVTQDGEVLRYQNNKVVDQDSTVGMTINPGCAAWSPDQCVFCVAGADGTATSSTGQEWMLHEDVPKDLRDLTWREDLECFFAWSYADKKFYVSGDGAVWTKLTNIPIPLEEVSCLDYSPELGWYCAIGGTGRTAYFSKDLKHWIGTTVTNGTGIEMNSVKYMPSVGKYILMPRSGSYYYIFDTSAWTDD